MATDEAVLSPREERTAAALRRALHEMSAVCPPTIDPAAWIERPRRSRRQRLTRPIGLAAALALAFAGLVAVTVRPGPLAAPATNHFDNGQFSFDYPRTWVNMSTDPSLTVLGTGKMCTGMPSSGCSEQTIDISGGTIVLQVWQTAQEAPAYCSAPGSGSGGSAAQKYTEDSLHANQPTTRWEIRRSGYEFGMDGNVWIEAVTSNQAELSNAQALVDSFHWDRDYCAFPTAAPALPGTAGHFDNGRFSFDYPSEWPTRSGEFTEGGASHVFAVIGTGVWHSGCRTVDNGSECTGDTVDVSGGRVVVELLERIGGPAPMCLNDVQANATLGPNAVQVTSQSGATMWEIRLPGYEFGWPNNVVIEAWTGSAEAMAQVEALVASFRWASDQLGPGYCAPTDEPSAATTPAQPPAISHYDADGISFDYPATWRILSRHQHWGLNGPTIEFAVGTGSVDSGCTELKPTGDVGGGVTCGASPKVSVGTGQVVVYWYVGANMLGPGPLPSGTLAPGAQVATVNGLPAIVTRGDGWAKWQISAIGYLAAEWGPDATDAEARVDALIASLRFNAAAFGV